MKVAHTSYKGLLGKLPPLRGLLNEPKSPRLGPNALVMLVCQVATTALALLLDSLGFSDATIVIIYVLGVLVTAMFTDGPAYSLVASLLSILSYNFFLISPRFSLQIQGRDYAGTITAMILFALLASYLVTSLRRSAAQSMEASLIAQREQLRANLLRSVSHDLRTPLTSITGNADMLLDDSVSLPQATRRQLLQDIYDDATWLRTVMENLLAVTRLEDGEVTLNTDVELIDDVIEEAMRHVSREAKHYDIMVVPPNDLLLARMDPQVIVQVIVNLVNNAIAHTPKGSTITITPYREQGMVAVEVADNGPGVPDKDKEQVFDLFYKSSDEGADARRNVGLGLSLCRSIIQAHGGTIRVEDAIPHGARFIFTLPAEEVPQHV